METCIASTAASFRHSISSTARTRSVTQTASAWLNKVTVPSQRQPMSLTMSFLDQLLGLNTPHPPPPPTFPLMSATKHCMNWNIGTGSSWLLLLLRISFSNTLYEHEFFL